MSSNKFKILLVEDEVNVAKLFTYTFEKAGYDCRVEKNGSDGYKAAQEYEPDIIISDIMMPQLDGYGFRKLLLDDQDLKNVPFVFLTAKGSEDDILNGYELDIEEYIIKTSSPKIITAKINSIIKSMDREKNRAVKEISSAANSMGAKVVPNKSPEFGNLYIEHWHQPYKEVPGGDFIDYIQLDNDNLAVILGDVMGKKWNAWYFAYAYAGYVRSAIRMTLESNTNHNPGSILQKVNEAVYKDERISEVFTTLSIVVINNKTKIISYAGAGDLPLIYFSSKNEKSEMVNSNGLLLGFSSHDEYNDIEIQLAKNDVVLLTTDGIIESENLEGEQFGFERLKATLELEPKNFISSIKKNLTNYTGNNFSDDVSLIYIRNIE